MVPMTAHTWWSATDAASIKGGLRGAGSSVPGGSLVGSSGYGS